MGAAISWSPWRRGGRAVARAGIGVGATTQDLGDPTSSTAATADVPTPETTAVITTPISVPMTAAPAPSSTSTPTSATSLGRPGEPVPRRHDRDLSANIGGRSGLRRPAQHRAVRHGVRPDVEWPDRLGRGVPRGPRNVRRGPGVVGDWGSAWIAGAWPDETGAEQPAVVQMTMRPARRSTGHPIPGGSHRPGGQRGHPGLGRRLRAGSRRGRQWCGDGHRQSRPGRVRPRLERPSPDHHCRGRSDTI